VEIRPDGATLVVTVTDDGAGLSASGGSARSSAPAESARMSGNGLATMRERAEELGGSLRVDSNGAGTRVIARIPLGRLSTKEG
jgi:signal transduction histidine kinase